MRADELLRDVMRGRGFAEPSRVAVGECVVGDHPLNDDVEIAVEPDCAVEALGAGGALLVGVDFQVGQAALLAVVAPPPPRRRP